MFPATRAAAATVRRSTRFVTWVRAWRAGLAPFDDIAGEIAGDEEHMVADAPGTWTDVPLREALTLLAKMHPDQIRLVLPVPGDPRGLPGPGPLTGAALVAEECVLAGEWGLVPEIRTHTSGSGDTFETVLWRVYPMPAEVPTRGAPPELGFGGGEHPPRVAAVPAGPVAHAPGVDDPGAAQAEAELSAALADATAQLARLDVAQWRPELSGALAALRRPDFAGDLPPGYNARARRLFARAAMLDQVLVLAQRSAPGGAVNGYEAQRRDDALRPLLAACRRALVAACNAPLS